MAPTPNGLDRQAPHARRPTVATHGRRGLPAMMLGLAISVGAVGAVGAAEAADPPDPIPLQDIAPGMTGYGLTVFGGAAIDTFGVTVIGVQHNVRPQGSLILVEVAGHGLELSSIAQGMSGSPIFLQGRLAGALAFGWSGALRPIAGVTPAQEILDLPTVAAPAAAASEPGSAAAFGGMSWTAGDLQPWGTGGLAADLLDRDDPLRISAAATAPRPLFRGLPDAPAEDWPAAADLILPLLRRSLPQQSGILGDPGAWILQPVGASWGRSVGPSGAAGAATGANTGNVAALQPGSACAVPLVLGDAALGAIGTVTWVDGQDVFMMGHPFLQRGPVNLPLATAEVLGIFPSRQMSFKMGSVGVPVGTVHHDQRAGLSGTLGAVPPLIPVQVRIAGETAPARQFDFTVVEDPQLTPTLVFWVLYNSLLSCGDDASEQTVRYDLKTRWSGPAQLADQGLRLQGIAAGPGGVQGLAVELMAPLAILLDNARPPVRLLGVDAEFAVSRPLAAAKIVGLDGPRALPAGGGSAVFQVECEPRQGARRTYALTLDLPPHLRPGNYRVVAASAAEFFALEAQRLAGRRDPRDLAALLQVLRAERAADRLVLALVAPGSGVVVQGAEMAGLPASVSRLMQAGSFDADPTLADILVKVASATPWLLQGHAVDTLELQAGGSPQTDERRP